MERGWCQDLGIQNFLVCDSVKFDTCQAHWMSYKDVIWEGNDGEAKFYLGFFPGILTGWPFRLLWRLKCLRRCPFLCAAGVFIALAQLTIHNFLWCDLIFLATSA